MRARICLWRFPRHGHDRPARPYGSRSVDRCGHAARQRSSFPKAKGGPFPEKLKSKPRNTVETRTARGTMSCFSVRFSEHANHFSQRPRSGSRTGLPRPSILCCAKCVDDFSKLWPGTAARDVELQHGYTTLDNFLKSGRIRDAFEPEEIERLSKSLTCPNCQAVLEGEFWIYEHPFSVPDEFWRTLDEIAALASRVRFLLLTHPFAEKRLISSWLGEMRRTLRRSTPRTIAPDGPRKFQRPAWRISDLLGRILSRRERARAMDAYRVRPAVA